jgi:uncharacterized membrane protein YfcA
MRRIEVKYVTGILSVLLIFAGIYLMFFADVPDPEAETNMWVSWLLLIFGIIGVVVSALWKKKKSPFIESDDDSGV